MKNKYVFFFVALFLAFALDQVTKELVRHYAPLHQELPVIRGFFYIFNSINHGMIFGFWQEKAGLFYSIVKLLGLALLPPVFLILVFQPRSALSTAAKLGILVGSGFGNMFDRLAYGGVTDFIRLKITLFGREFQWYNFNVADALMVVSVFLVFFNWPRDPVEKK